MTMLYSSQGTIRFPIAVGQTLIVQNISGVETVSGSSASREDASARFGSGYFVYGPQSSAGTIQLSTTGQLDYQLVVGDATPWNNFIPLSGSSSGVSAGGDLAAGSAAVAAALGLAAGKGFKLPSWRAALAAMKAGTRNARIYCPGDSTTAGNFASGTQYGANASLAWPARLAAYLTAARLPASNASICGASILTAGQFATWYPGSAINGSWALDGSFKIPGYQMFRHNGAGADDLVLPISGYYDTVSIIYFKGSGYGQAQLKVDGGSTVYGTFDSANASTIVARASISVPAGNHTSLTFSKVAATGQFFLCAVICTNSATKQVEIYNAGWGGSKASDWADATNIWSPSSTAANNILSAYAPDLSIFNVGINDSLGATATATYLANLTTAAAAAATYGDVLLIAPFRISSGSASEATQLGIAQQVRALAQSNGYGLIDLAAHWGSYAQSTAAGYWSPAADPVHPCAPGYDEIGQVVASLVPTF